MTFHAVARKTPRKRPEQDLHRFVVQLLKFSAVKHLVHFHVPNGEARSKLTGAILNGLGVRAGVADFVFVLPGGRAAFLELKDKAGWISQPQRAFRADVEAAGALYAIARTPEEVQAILGSWGAIRRNVRPSEAKELEAAE